MSENIEESQTETAGTEKTRPSIPLTIGGIIAITIGGWALTGQTFGALIRSDLLGWVAIIAAVAIGVALVVLPGRRNKTG